MRFFCFFLLMSASLGFGQGKTPGSFKPSAAPSKADWKFFFQVSPEFRTSVWTDLKNRGVKLRDWSWQWRMAWLQSCLGDGVKVEICDAIAMEASEDRAYVVRVRATDLLAKMVERAGDKRTREEIFTQLVKVYFDERNNMKGMKQSIERRIVFHLVSQKEKTLAAFLVKSSPSMQSYLKKLNF